MKWHIASVSWGKDSPMKGYYKGQPRGVFELEQRFRAELEREAADNA